MLSKGRYSFDWSGVKEFIPEDIWSFGTLTPFLCFSFFPQWCKVTTFRTVLKDILSTVLTDLHDYFHILVTLFVYLYSSTFPWQLKSLILLQVKTHNEFMSITNRFKVQIRSWLFISHTKRLPLGAPYEIWLWIVFLGEVIKRGNTIFLTHATPEDVLRMFVFVFIFHAFLPASCGTVVANWRFATRRKHGATAPCYRNGFWNNIDFSLSKAVF